MEEKDLIKQIIENLQDERELAEGMLALLNAGFMDDETVHGMVFLLEKEIKGLPKGEKKSELEELLNQVMELEQKEEEEENDE